MKKNVLILFFLLAPILNTYSSGFGFRYEFSYLSTNLKDHASPVNIFLSFKTNIYSLTYLKLNLGLSHYEELYGGLNGSVFIENEFYKTIKVIMGVNIHKNGGTAHGTIEAFKKIFVHLVIGGGINVSKDTSLDFLVYFPTEKKYSANYYKSPIIAYRKVNYILKLGLDYYF